MRTYYLMALIVAGIGMGLAVAYGSGSWFLYFVICAAFNLIGVNRL